jgi:hypothetical protein
VEAIGQRGDAGAAQVERAADVEVFRGLKPCDGHFPTVDDD